MNDRLWHWVVPVTMNTGDPQQSALPHGLDNQAYEHIRHPADARLLVPPAPRASHARAQLHCNGAVIHTRHVT